MNANLYALFHRRFREGADAPCLIAPDRVWSFADIDALSARFAGAFADAGLEPGDRIVAQVDKSVEAVGLYLGVLRAGGVFVPLNTAYTPSEVDFFLKDAAPRLFIQKPAPGSAPRPQIAQRDPEDLASILYTSGTTGRSKGAMLSHRALSSNAAALSEIWGLSSDDVLIHALPIFHIHGLFVALNTSFLNASKVIFLPRFDPGEVRRRMREATMLMGVPTFYSRLLDDGVTREDCANMRLFISGSAPLTEEVSKEWTRRTGHKILERYGMTEAGMIASNPLDGERIPGTVGYALPGVDIRVADAAGRELSRGEVGTVEVKGPNLFSGYWRLPDKTAEEMRADGYFITGDMGSMAPDGRLRLVGRAKDLIISGGYNIYPKEIEAVLDAIEGVKESAVIGAPHRDLGEGVVAVLVAETTPVDETVIKAALDERLARFKHPRRFYWASELPRNAMGKVQKNALRQAYAEAYA